MLLYLKFRNKLSYSTILNYYVDVYSVVLVSNFRWPVKIRISLYNLPNSYFSNIIIDNYCNNQLAHTLSLSLDVTLCGNVTMCSEIYIYCMSAATH